MVLSFRQAEKQLSDTVVFPAFSLSVEPGKVTAIHSNVNIRQQLMDLLAGKSSLSSGTITVLEQELSKTTKGIGFFFLETGFYERLTVQETLKFYQQLYTSPKPLDEMLQMVQLEQKRKTKVEKLTFSEKKRLQMASLLFQDPEIYVLEEPDQNLDNESKRIFLSLIQTLQKGKKSLLLLTGNMESAVTLGNGVYRLNDAGLHQVEVNDEEQEIETISVTDVDESLSIESIQPIRFEKIPTKVNEKIVLFDPPEIDYIESSDGQSYLHIKGEAFPSYFTLNDLEERLLPYGFFRCHRSYIVNLQKVREVITWTKNSYSLVLEDAQKSNIPLSKTKMASLKEMLGLK